MRKLTRPARAAARRLRLQIEGGRKPRAHFLHIRKTAGTAIKTALTPYLTEGSYAIELHPHQFTMQEIPAGQKFFFVVRDPIARFVSGFYSRQRPGDVHAPDRRGRPRANRPWTPGEAAAFGRFSTANELAEAIYSDEAAKVAMTQINHVRSFYWDWFGDAASFLARGDDLLMVLRQEQLAQDFDVLTDRLGLAGRATLPTDDVGTHRNPETVDKTLSETARANLGRWYEPDFEFLEVCEQVQKR
jgi:hypothetical protein